MVRGKGTPDTVKGKADQKELLVLVSGLSFQLLWAMSFQHKKSSKEFG